MLPAPVCPRDGAAPQGVLYWRDRAHIPPARKTVMVVDSDESSRERLSQILRRDHRVLRAGSAEAGLGLIGKDGVDVVLADHARCRA